VTAGGGRLAKITTKAIAAANETGSEVYRALRQSSDDESGGRAIVAATVAATMAVVARGVVAVGEVADEMRRQRSNAPNPATPPDHDSKKVPRK
jgi:uncharacterized membrane protein